MTMCRDVMWCVVGRHFAGQHNLLNGNPNWLEKYCPYVDKDSPCADADDVWRRYLISIYFTTTTMTSTGYGDVVGVANVGAWCSWHDRVFAVGGGLGCTSHCVCIHPLVVLEHEAAVPPTQRGVNIACCLCA